ncbi:MAG: cupredoxin domain-containing protein [Candidatus Liptonbacteria bacterium]|nr:cupredoxin domain-containing protein [Candidatus Liptonbacteria bacterium]
MKKPILYLVLGVVVVLIILVIGRSPSPTPVTNVPTQSPTSTENPVSPTPTPGAKSTPSATTPVKKPPLQTQNVKILSPLEGAEWVIDANNVIEWSKAAGISGGIYLVDAATNSTFGWITSNLGGSQTSFTWDARDVFLTRGNPSKKNLPTGRYYLKIKFDSATKPELQSGVFSIIYASQAKPTIHETLIQNLSFNPSSLTVKQKDQIKIQNQDSVTYTLTPSSSGEVKTLPPGGSTLIDTAYLPLGSYDYYSESYPSLRLKITVVK